MLRSLYINNIAIIAQLNIEFHAGMTSITGETGAGKSIVIDSLALSLGARADQSLIKHGCDQAEVIAEFDISKNSSATQWIKRQQLELDEPQCILKRKLYANSPSKSFINDRPVSATVLSQLGERLVTICGQREHLNLIDPAARLAIIDNHAQTATSLKKIQEAYKALSNINDQIQALKNAQSEGVDHVDLLSFMIDELEQGNYTADDYHQQDKVQKRLSHNSDIVHAVNTSIELLNSSASENVVQLLSQITKLLNNSLKFEPRLKNALETINDATIACEDAVTELTDISGKLEIDPDQLAQVEQKLSSYHNLARKHRCEPGELETKLNELNTRLNFIQNSDQQLQKLKLQRDTLTTQYYDMAGVLTQKRCKSAKRLSKLISLQLAQLNLKGSTCQIECTTDVESIHPKGQDSIRLLISTNSGQPPGPVEKIASGGELSRIGMAIALETSQQADNAVLIFDEVDSGISGKTADIVGDKLKDLALKNQTICITHLPQVACKAEHQLRVSKNNKNKSKIKLDYLDTESRVIELARFLSGKEITDESLANARVMLKESI